MHVRILSADKNAEFCGNAILSPSRHKDTVCVIFDVPLQIDVGYGRTRPSRTEEFRLRSRSRTVWGQGMDYDANDYFLHPDDALEIIIGGGG